MGIKTGSRGKQVDGSVPRGGRQMGIYLFVPSINLLSHVLRESRCIVLTALVHISEAPACPPRPILGLPKDEGPVCATLQGEREM